MAKVKRHSCVSDSHTASLSGDESAPLLSSQRSGYGGTETVLHIDGGDDNKDTQLSTSSGGQGIHCHDGPQQATGIDKKARRKLIIACVLCFFFMAGEVIGGVLANSLAIATDAAHLLTDVASFMISLFALYIASRPATKRMSFGWYRAEVVGALVSVLMIWVVTGILVFMAVQRVVSGDYEIEGGIMLITAAVGVAVNIVMGFTLHDTHGHSHGGHSHGGQGDGGHSAAPKMEASSKEDHPGSPGSEGEHSHEHSNEGRSGTNINVRAAFIHVIGDLIQSLGVLVAAFVIFFYPEAKIADPICTFLFSVLVLVTTINILRDTLNVLMEGTPRGLSFNDIKMSLLEIPGVQEVHNLRIWSLTTSKTALAVHLALEQSKRGTDAQDVLARASQMMKDRFGIYEVTVQIENYVDQMEDCNQCKEPGD